MDEFDDSDVSTLEAEMDEMRLLVAQNKKRIADLEAQFDKYCWRTDDKLREYELILKHLGSTSKE